MFLLLFSICPVESLVKLKFKFQPAKSKPPFKKHLLLTECSNNLVIIVHCIVDKGQRPKHIYMPVDIIEKYHRSILLFQLSKRGGFKIQVLKMPLQSSKQS